MTPTLKDDITLFVKGRINGKRNELGEYEANPQLPYIVGFAIGEHDRKLDNLKMDFRRRLPKPPFPPDAALRPEDV
jgi:hypothetical protein